MSRKHKHKSETIIFTECEECGGFPAMWRWFNGKTLCSECATKAFIKYLAGLAGTAAILYLFFR
jgi:formylmethanofuran dehydrogenase subunit E